MSALAKRLARHKKHFEVACVAYAVGGVLALYYAVDEIGERVRCPRCKGAGAVPSVTREGTISLPCKVCVGGHVNPRKMVASGGKTRGAS